MVNFDPVRAPRFYPDPGEEPDAPVAWMAGPRETDALKPIDKAIGKDGRE